MTFVTLLKDALGVELINNIADFLVMLVMVALSRFLSESLKIIYKRFFIKIMRKLKK
jgi:hypothetical protein